MNKNNYILFFTASLIIFSFISCETEDEPPMPEFGKTPCPGTPTIIYKGHEYPTIQIGNQCWLKENLNIGVQIHSGEQSTDNGVIEKYCFDDDPVNCEALGGLYKWDEIMQYTNNEGAQGICPDGWHIPTHRDINLLRGTTFNNTNYLKIYINNKWRPVEDDLTVFPPKRRPELNGSGFSGIPSGYMDTVPNSFIQTEIGKEAYFWLSKESEINMAYKFHLDRPEKWFFDEPMNKNFGLSVRCIKNKR